jgi:hypothetical protein
VITDLTVRKGISFNETNDWSRLKVSYASDGKVKSFELDAHFICRRASRATFQWLADVPYHGPAPENVVKVIQARAVTTIPRDR